MKKFFLVLAAAAMLAPVATVQPAQANVIHQVTNNTIIINGSVFNPQNPILNINDRLMVPFREFGERMGATVGWEESNRRITLTRNNIYSILHIGNSVIQHGEFIMMGSTFHPTSQNQTIMDVPAMLVANVTYIPLAAVAQSMGATVQWDPNTATATITAASQPITTLPGLVPPTAQPLPDTVDRPSNYNDFGNTSHFRIISARQANQRHNDSNDYPFLVVFYNSDEEHSRMMVPSIQDAAQRVGFEIFGVDRAMTGEHHANSNNSWLWSFVRESAFEEPAMVLVHGRNNVTIHNRTGITRNLTAGETINNQFVEQTIRNFRTRAETGLNPGAFLSNTTHWQHRTSAQIRNFHQSHEEFIVVVYDGSLDEAEFHVPLIVAAAGETQHRIYAVDIDRNPQYRNHLDFLPGINTNLANRMPMMFLVYSPNNPNVNRRIDEFNRPNNVAGAVTIIEEFIDNSMFYERNNQGNTNQGGGNTNLGNTNQWQSRTAAEIATMRNNQQEFVLVLFDGSNNQANQNLQAVRTGAGRVTGHRVYTVDISLGVNSNFRDQLWFLPGITNNLSGILPVIYQVYNTNNNHGWSTQVHNGPHSANQAETIVRNFVDRALHMTPNQPGSGSGNNDNNSTNNQGQGDLAGHAHFTHTNATTVTQMIANDSTFVVVLYDSRNTASRNAANEVRTAATLSRPIFAVNIGTTTHNADNLGFLLAARGGTSLSVNNPVMLFYQNGILSDIPLTLPTNDPISVLRDAELFIRNNLG